MTTILNGLVGGLLVGLLAAIVTQVVDSDSSATMVVLQRTVGARFARSRWWTLGVQVFYGGLAGVIFIVLELFALQALAIPPTVGEAFSVAIGWSALLFVVWVVIVRVGLSHPKDRSLLAEVLAYHLVYGLGLGMWIRLTWIT